MEDKKIFMLVVIIIVVIIVSILIFRNVYKTQEERDENISRLFIGIIVAVLIIVAFAYLFMNGSDDVNEYGGIRAATREWYKAKRAKREAAADAKRAHKAAAKKKHYQEKYPDGADF